MTKKILPASPKRVRHRKTQNADAATTAAAADAAAAARLLTSAYRLKSLILTKYVCGFISATDVAEISWWIRACNIPGFEELGTRNPDEPSFQSNAHRNVHKILPLCEIERDMYHITIPMCDERSGVREQRAAPMLPLHEVLAAEFLENPEVLMKHAADLQWPTWLENEVRLSAAEDEVVIPYGHFLDAAPWKGKGAGTMDSVLAFNVNLLGDPLQRRRSIFTIRKDFMCGDNCGCPCRGRCTLDVVENALLWSARHAASGYMPFEGHRNGSPLQPTRAALAGLAVCLYKGKRIRFAMIQFRADGAQYADLGFMRANQEGFCVQCRCPKSNMYDFQNCGAWPLWTHDVFMATMHRSMIRVLLSQEDASVVMDCLENDTRKDGMHGRVLDRDLLLNDAATGQFVLLRHFDRLQYGGSCVDVHGELVGTPPFTLHFWRKLKDVPLRFPVYIMFFPGAKHEYLMLDDLHNLDLGVSARLCGVGIMRALKLGVFGNDGTKQGLTCGLRVLNAKLREYYKTENRRRRQLSQSKLTTHSGLKLTSLQFKTLSSKGHLNGKGNEVRDIVPFVCHQVMRPGNKFLRRALVRLQLAYQLMQRKEVDHKRLHTLFVGVGRDSVKAKVPLIPKFHYLAHWGKQCERAGNPAACSTKPDEAKNADIVRVAQMCKTRDFAARILSRDIVKAQLERELARVLHAAACETRRVDNIARDEGARLVPTQKYSL
jgi:hypothetical protein